MKISERALVYLFLIFLLLPVFFLNHDTNRVLSMENRRAAQYPGIFTPDGKLKDNFTGHFENYWNDNIGFKEFAVTANIVIMHKMFGLYSEPHILTGEENHLFYMPGDVTNPATLPPHQIFDELYLKNTLENINVLHNYLAARNIPFVFVTIPDKEEVYPEFYPSSFLVRPEKSSLSQIVHYIQENSDIDALDLSEALIAEKNEASLLYYRNYDPSHWNMNGAFVGYVKMMERFKAYDDDLVPFTRDDFDIEEITHMKKTGNGVYMFNNLSDIKYEYKRDFTAQFVDTLHNAPPKADIPPMPAPIPKEKLNAWGVWLALYSKNIECQNGKKLLILCDSYIDGFIKDFFADNFSEVYLLSSSSYYDGAVIKTAIDVFEPDFVLYEIVERVYNANSQFSHFRDVANKIANAQLFFHINGRYSEQNSLKNSVMNYSPDDTYAYNVEFDLLNSAEQIGGLPSSMQEIRFDPAMEPITFYISEAKVVYDDGGHDDLNVIWHNAEIDEGGKYVFNHADPMLIFDSSKIDFSKAKQIHFSGNMKKP
jgi:hypothetical protein